MRRWDGLVDGYVGECEARGLSPSMLYMIRRELTRCGEWLKGRRPRVKLEAVDGAHMVQYFRMRGVFHSKSTVYASVSKLRGMGEYLVRQGVWLKNPMRWIRGPRIDPHMRLPRRIGREDMKRLWDQAALRPKRQQAITLCVLAVLYGTGLRRGELSRLNIADWSRETGMLKIDGRKTGQERQIPVGPGVWRCVEAYLPIRQNRLEACGYVEEPAFLISRFGRRMSGDAISRTVKMCAKAAGIPFVSLHQFRHSCASDLLEGGASMPEVKSILGHAVIGTTMRYIHVSSGARTEAIKRHPINEFLANPGGAERKVAI
jgi:site-specific recombinase XerD